MNFIKNTNDTFKFYSLDKESFFYNKHFTKNKIKKDDFIIARTILIELRKIEYSFLDYFNSYGKHKTVQYISSTLDLNKQLDLISLCYSYMIKYYDNSSFSTSENFANTLIRFNTFIYELHDRLSFYYRVMNEKMLFKNNNINLIFINKHNQCLHYIIKHFNTNTLPTMLFFDSHTDQNSPTNNNFDTIENEDDNDIGAVNIPIFLNYEKNNGYHWIVPDCNPTAYAKFKIGITNKLKFACTDEDIEYIKKSNLNDDKWLDFLITGGKYDKNNEFIQNIQPISHTITNIDYFNFIDDITDNYILNIDLDYFIAYGNGIEDYENTAYDLITDNLSTIDFENSKSHDGERDGLRKINKEIESLRNKIDNFLIFLNKIKLRGKIPKMIIFCDSSRLDFSLFDNCIGSGDFHKHENKILINAFLPKRYAFWLVNTLLNNIKSLFGEEIIIIK